MVPSDPRTRLLLLLACLLPAGLPAETPAPDRPFDLAQRRAEHWAWQPVRTAPLPQVERHDWANHPIDRFILAELERAGLEPAPRAETSALVRRLYFDLVGLPPGPDDLDEFLADESPDAWARLVDRLLASPRFGERWARHWLDLVRYAETRGHEFDHTIPNAYQYRDYVIRALNADVPYDQFVTEHIAGDLVRPPRLHPVQGFNESVLGTGFWALGEEVHSPVDIRGDETDRVDNKIDVFSKTFLSVTVSCARCHDHKFDAISARDYYALAGFLLSSSYRQVPFESLEHNERLAWAIDALRQAGRAGILKEIARSWTAIERTSEYLLAARQVILKEATDPKRPGAAAEAVAGAGGLELERLAAWIDYLRPGERAAGDPMQLWSLVARTDGARAALGGMIESSRRDLRRQVEQFDAALQRGRVVVDYRRPGEHPWLADGFAFGVGPARAGDVRFGTDAQRPIATIFHSAAARTNSLWRSPEPAPGVEREPGKVAWLQASRTLRTPTFRIGSGKLFYLVQGGGHAYAAVDSHRMVAGPLHGALIRTWDATDGSKPHWVAQDLSAYKGHRVHVEFSPRDPAADRAEPDLAIMMVVESEGPPPLPPDPQIALLEPFAGDSVDSIERIAESYQRAFQRVRELLEADSLVSLPDAGEWAWLADWMIEHGELFAGDAVSPGAGRASRGVERSLDAEADRFFARLGELQAQIRSSRTAPALLDGNGVDEYLLARGNHRTPGDPVARRFLEAVDGSVDPIAGPGSGRRELAGKVACASNPLAARSIVNRVWHHLFGRGLVASVDDFGALGERPTHPELLDYLAARFVEQGWSIKQLIRELVGTNLYQMSAITASSAAMETDPRNRLWHRMPVRRLEAEAIRDSVLAVSGRLDSTMYGPSVEVHLTPFLEGRGRPGTSGPLDGAGRRSVYLKIRRNFLPPMLTAFDAPTPFSTMGRRSASNVPAQALALMNGPFVVEQASVWARRVLAEPDSSDSERVTRMYLDAFARLPSAEELADSLAFLRAQRAAYGGEEQDGRPWTDLAHVLVNVKEFVFVR